MIALINAVLKNKMVKDKDSVKTMEFYRDFLKEKNKALFAATVSELSKLSFYFGLDQNVISAT